MTTPGTGMRTEAEVMAVTATSVEGVADSLTTELTGLMDKLSIMSTAWQGAGGTAFQNTRVQVEEKMAQLNVALRSIAEAVRTSGTNYVVTDDEMRVDLEGVGASTTMITAALQIN
jgi:WXG100 family type VII secretion target